MNPNNQIAFIPARGGSKGIPKKNLALVASRPLIDYTIDVAKNPGRFSRVIVSTDDIEIAKHALNQSCEVHIRPAYLATDESRVVEVLLDAAETMSFSENAVVAVLQPTSPLRETADVDAALELFFANDQRPVISVVKCEHHPLKTVRIEAGVILREIDGDAIESSRQELPVLYRPNGAIYVSSVASIQRNRTLVPGSAIPLIMSRENSVDVDDFLDLVISEALLKRRRDSLSIK